MNRNPLYEAISRGAAPPWQTGAPRVTAWCASGRCSGCTVTGCQCRNARHKSGHDTPDSRGNPAVTRCA